MTELLIKHGANVNALDADNDTPLHWAAQHGNLLSYVFIFIETILFIETSFYSALETDKVADVLIKNGANVSAVNNIGWTPLHYCASNGNLQSTRHIAFEPDSKLENCLLRIRKGSKNAD